MIKSVESIHSSQPNDLQDDLHNVVNCIRRFNAEHRPSRATQIAKDLGTQIILKKNS